MRNADLSGCVAADRVNEDRHHVPVDPDRSADPVRSGAALTPVRNADLSGCVAADRVNEDSGDRLVESGYHQ
ncbi:MAG: hypothetical protein LBL04_01320 [Bacteroidales bacterium]|nr:hypothetical protein [Bacteroidales bacterium]